MRERLGDDADPGFCAACHQATGGNPLLLRQLLRALEAEGVQPIADQAAVVRAVGPRAVSSTVLLRLSRLSDDARAVARATAVLGESADLPRVAALAGRDERAVAAASGELIRAEIIRPEPPLGFVHPLVRDAVYHELPPAERELEHERAAEMLREAGAASSRSPRSSCSRRAAAPPGPRSCSSARAATRCAAGRRRAPSPTCGARSRSRPRPSSASRSCSSSASPRRSRPGPPRRSTCRRPTTPSPTRRPAPTVAAVLSRVRLFMGDADGAARIAGDAAAAVAPVAPDTARALEAVELMSFFFGGGDEGALQRMASHRHPPEAPGPGAKALAGVAAYDWLNRGGHVDECVALCLTALEGEELPEMDSTLLSIPTVLPLVMGDRPEALEHVRRLQEFGHRRGSLLDVSSLQLWLGFTQYRLGDLEAAEDLLRRANEGFAVYGLGSGPRAFSDAFLTEVLIDRGDVAGARKVLESNSDQGDASNASRFYVHARMRLLAAEGRWEEVLRETAAFETRFRHYRDAPDSPWRVLRADALDRLERTARRSPWPTEELAAARAVGRARHGGPRAHAAGPAGARRGHRAPRGGRRPAATARPRSSSTPARCFALGSAIRHARRPADARDPLRRALELATVCGAPPLAEAARSELYAAGARPRTEALAGVDALTASEKRVADLAAAGDTNRDIAQALYVTPKTVEVHLSNTYRKLGIRSRRDLAGGARGRVVTLLERDAELAALDEVVAAAAAGQGRFVLIEGPAGIGKTGLLADLRERAAGAGLRVLSARVGRARARVRLRRRAPALRARGGGRGRPRGRGRAGRRGVRQPRRRRRGRVVRGAPRALLAHAQPRRGRPAAARGRRPALGRPRVGALPRLPREAARGDAGAGRRHAALGRARHRPAAARRDRAATRRRSCCTPARSAPPPSRGSSASGSARTPTPRSAPPRTPPRAATRCCCASSCARWRPRASRPPPEQVEAIRAIGPRAVASTVLLRLARLSPAAAAVARAISVLGGRADLRATAALAELDDDATAAAVRELVRAEIVRPEPPLAFVHALVRDAVYHELPPGERDLAHEARRARAARPGESSPTTSPPSCCSRRGAASPG